MILLFNIKIELKKLLKNVIICITKKNANSGEFPIEEVSYKIFKWEKEILSDNFIGMIGGVIYMKIILNIRRLLESWRPLISWFLRKNNLEKDKLASEQKKIKDYKIDYESIEMLERKLRTSNS